MKKYLMFAMVLGLTLAMTGTASAQRRGGSGFNQDNMYIGGGIGMNSVSGWDDATGFQIFAGYELSQKLGDLDMAIEVGYMDTGDFETTVGPFTLTTKAKGLWATGVGTYVINREFDFLARLGLDFGDDDGLMFGIGGAYKINKEMSARLEYVIRDNIDSLQANFVYRF